MRRGQTGIKRAIAIQTRHSESGTIRRHIFVIYIGELSSNQNAPVRLHIDREGPLLAAGAGLIDKQSRLMEGCIG